MQHLLGGVFEQTPAAAREQHVAAEKMRRAARIGRLEIRDMAGRVTRNVDHRQIHRGVLDTHRISAAQTLTAQTLNQMLDALAGRAVDGNAALGLSAIEQRFHAADVVVVMVRE